MDTTQQSLRISIDGSWTATEMANSFSEINLLYSLRLYLNSAEDAGQDLEELYDFFPPFRRLKKLHRYPNPFLHHYGALAQRPEDIQQFARLYYPEYVLRVERIEFASPGGKDFFGIGEILRQVREFIQYLIELRQNREQQRLSNDAQRIQNARDFVKLRLEYSRANAKIAGIESDGLAEIVDDNTRAIQRLVESGKITSVAMLDKDRENLEQGAE